MTASQRWLANRSYSRDPYGITRAEHQPKAPKNSGKRRALTQTRVGTARRFQSPEEATRTPLLYLEPSTNCSCDQWRCFTFEHQVSCAPLQMFDRHGGTRLLDGNDRSRFPLHELGIDVMVPLLLPLAEYCSSVSAGILPAISTGIQIVTQRVL